MGLLSWLRFKAGGPSPRDPSDGPTGRLWRTRPAPDPKLANLERDAAADVAWVSEDDKYFDPDNPGQQQDDL